MEEQSRFRPVTAPVLSEQRPGALSAVRQRWADALATCRDARPADTASVADLRHHLDRIYDRSGLNVFVRRRLVQRADFGAHPEERAASLWDAIDDAEATLHAKLRA